MSDDALTTLGKILVAVIRREHPRGFAGIESFFAHDDAVLLTGHVEVGKSPEPLSQTSHTKVDRRSELSAPRPLCNPVDHAR